MRSSRKKADTRMADEDENDLVVATYSIGMSTMTPTSESTAGKEMREEEQMEELPLS